MFFCELGWAFLDGPGRTTLIETDLGSSDSANESAIARRSVDDRKRRRPVGALDAAEAVLRQQPAKAPEAIEPTAIPGARELVSLRLDQDVLAPFQEAGLGWQDRIDQALRKAAGLI